MTFWKSILEIKNPAEAGLVYTDFSEEIILKGYYRQPCSHQPSWFQ